MGSSALLVYLTPFFSSSEDTFDTINWEDAARPGFTHSLIRFLSFSNLQPKTPEEQKRNLRTARLIIGFAGLSWRKIKIYVYRSHYKVP